MPISRLIAVATAAKTAMTKAFTDDDSPAPAAPVSGQERDTQDLAELLAGLRRERLDNARETLRQSALALGKSPGSTFGLSAEALGQALDEQGQASSEYAQTLGAILNTAGPAGQGCSPGERNGLLTHLRTHELVHWSIEPTLEERADLTAMKQALSRLEQLQRLRQRLQQLD